MNEIAARIELIAKRLAARTDRDGVAHPGYKQNVATLKAEMHQLQNQLGASK